MTTKVWVETEVVGKMYLVDFFCYDLATMQTGWRSGEQTLMLVDGKKIFFSDELKKDHVDSCINKKHEIHFSAVPYAQFGQRGLSF